MPRKRHTPEEIVAKLRQVDVLVSQGQSALITRIPQMDWRSASAVHLFPLRNQLLTVNRAAES